MPPDNIPDAPIEIHSAGVIGDGLMGAAIAAEHAEHQIPVKLFDTNQEALARTVSANYITPAESLKDLSDVDLVVEAGVLSCDEALLAA